MTTAWAHLPNAAVIDAVIADAKARPDKWSAANTKVWDDCAYMLDLPSTTLRTMIDLCDAPACYQAAMLLVGALAKEVTPA